ncbi:MAG: AraC family transcriptional regulator [Azospirillaceae bacterium]|nr:AraC family transcriptional regulator [Azospirillaceae bacterium]
MSSELKGVLRRYMDAQRPGDGIFGTPIDGLGLLRSSTQSLPHSRIFRASLCLSVQGAKQAMLGDQIFEYGEMQALVVSLELPMSGRVSRASAEIPYMGMVLELDVATLRAVMGQLDRPPAAPPTAAGPPSLFVQSCDGALADCMLRLMRLLDTPAAIPVLYPALTREICYWLLTGPNGGAMAALALPTGAAQRIAQAIRLLRDDLARPVRVGDLAQAAHMSASSFHQHFKTLTAMTPLQFQKQLRLLEARRLMVAEAATVAGAAYQVGYESPSQFSREYARLFGAPPKRDAVQLKADPMIVAAQLS